MKNLHTLAAVEVHPRKVGVIKELQELRKLSMLSITNLSADVHGRTLCSCIEKMENLKQLSIFSSSENEILGVQHISSPRFLDLQFLGLKGRLERFPDWIMKLQNLRGLQLSFSRLINNAVASVGDLPNLVFLALNQAYDGEELHFDEGRFLKLKELHLRKLKGLQVLKIDRGALLRLEIFKIGDCQKLKVVTTGIQSLEKLKDLTIYDMPVEFTDVIHGYFRDVRHAPYIRVCSQFDQQD
ncbi:hypothetical protein TIFTF001_052363 [Ficus carica]|uniref:Disease resistance R13L4/SHOC-2-like LRR domain-containing protein n=1 Tax=Ficus carica TaxID=3494 RepID=A0AA88JIX6_FICCA|nr:hypothetical protein TIFTF001_052363 [Ficus carica]